MKLGKIAYTDIIYNSGGQQIFVFIFFNYAKVFIFCVIKFISFYYSKQDNYYKISLSLIGHLTDTK